MKDHEQYGVVGTSLDNLISQIRRMEAPDILRMRAEIVYQDGRDSIENRQLDSAQASNNRLMGAVQDCSDFTDISGRVDKVYGVVKQIAAGKVEKGKVDALYREVIAAVSTGEVERLRGSFSRLENYGALLGQEFKMVFRQARHEGQMKNGVDRYFTGESGKRESGVYMFSSAFGQSDQPLRVDIYNEETQRTDVVEVWGEKVGTSTRDPLLQRLLNDKKDNGHIDNSSLSEDEMARGVRNVGDNRAFGEKKRGYESFIMYLTDDRGQPFERTGQITQW
ncbi:MAG: DUF6384 family protein [archaeon]